ncbi:MAG: bifunctional folylpolyglutamate synthase/dihydrofolate synthase [Selenomonas ruminantium]|jgi:dihydrofolate synthase/folylpolyglutamate synthase|uniref:tetrahydrofolate synthase n=1 Tax=Selenomonas ruminantium TaxID=971 RepID=A0A927ZPI9_SELRU|nr:folylpolyglutamate synthase/dihydrofolate synthase family protein [Selenomonas ruminantium]MBE6084104.1 bifunctional folylpolyglutamate synthase/dihydrofolate synthase [Selenomonas ruminantium]
MNYQESLAYLESLNIFGIKLGLERIQKLLARLELPQERYRTIHVTGTNGKGSVSAMLAGILRHSGIHTGFYSSPHLVSYTERIRVDGQPISEQEFADCLSSIKVYIDKMIADGEECPTQFEVLTALAFFYFAIKHVEYAVIEVGLGGLLDSTNVIVPEVSIITNVTLEHADRCGGTLEGVAHHKAGIIKDDVPVVTAAQGVALDIIRQQAEEKNADIFVAGEDFSADFISYEGNFQRLEFSSGLLGAVKEPYTLHLLGKHQIENAAVAVMAAKLISNLDSRITNKTIDDALTLVSWPARFEQADYNGQKIIIDGAHNPAGMTALRESLDLYFPAPERVLLLGILKDKDIDTMLDILLRPNDTVVVTVPHSDRASDPQILAGKVAAHVQHVEAIADNSEAMNRALELANGEKLLIMAGSLYLVGGLRKLLMDKKGGEA